MACVVAGSRPSSVVFRGDAFCQSVRAGPAIDSVGYAFAARTRLRKAGVRSYLALYGIWPVLCARTLAGNTDQRTNRVTNIDKRIMVTNTDKQIIVLTRR